MAFMRRLLDDRTGATAIEYGLIVALVALAAIVAMQGVGNAFSGTMTRASGAMERGNSGA